MKLYKLLVFTLFLGSCSNPNSALPPIISGSESEYNYNSGNRCEEEDTNHQCYDQCRKIYNLSRDRTDCEEDLTSRQIEDIYELYKELSNPSEEKLLELDLRVFELYLGVSIASLDNLIKNYSSRQAEILLLWLVKDQEIAGIFRDEDGDLRTLESLLKQIENFDSDTIYEPFLAKTGRDRLMEVAIKTGDKSVIEWFQDFIEKNNEECDDDTETRACFAIYCKIGDIIDRDSRDEWLEFEIFEAYIEDIIDAKVNSQQGTGDKQNSDGWIHEDAIGNDREQIGGIEDLDDDWVNDLCEDLTDGHA